MTDIKVLLFLLHFAPAAVAAVTIDSGVSVPAGFTAEVLAQGLTKATAMEFAPDGRLFVAEQGGRLRVIKNGTLLATPFLTVSTDSVGERGLLGIAFDPGFASNKFVYIYYTVPGSPPHNRVSRFTANGDVAAPGSSVILELEALSATNHNGGAIHFGLDGKLYIAVGENATGSNAQLLSNRLGKLLRINPDGTLPSDNPTAFSGVSGTTSGNKRAIWAIGLRNPFTFAIKRGSGKILVNDVGRSAWEEINVGGAGRNYGWPATEGPTGNPNFTSPLHSYQNDETSGCAISGGAFYDSQAKPFPASYVGRYFFADLCAGMIWHINPDIGPPDSQFASGISAPVDLKVGADGFLYYLARGKGLVGRIRPTGTTPPPPSCASPTQIANSRFASDGGFAYIITMPFGTQPDIASAQTRSILRVFENGVEMGPAHSSHSSIRSLGSGRFSHWHGTADSLRLSALNNSNVKTNGRRYTFCF